ncbi:phosphodiester glycosidase family protein [Gaopeijia maritima]|uniref:Phosphodiester glycosidase family protein n=1 Tax=Gaopeijia maritima TaxID=3119007 RepID=A0ABU9EBQ9_9BACT
MRARLARGPLLAGLATIVAAGCGSDPGASLPSAVAEAFPPDTLRSREVSQGVRYHYLWAPEGPFAIHLVEVSLDRCGLDFDVGLANADGTPGLRRVTEIAAASAEERPVLVAVNGDFFTAEGHPVGTTVRRGDVHRDQLRPAFAWRRGDGAWIGPVEVDSGRLTGAGWAVDEGEVDVVSGFPEVLDGGVRVGDLGVADNPSFAAARHPRTAVAVDSVRGRLWLIVADGRQGEYATGLTLPELAVLAEALGAAEAINLDGGGSSVMVIEGAVVSRPSDATGERAVANALLLVADPAGCRSGR